MLEIIALIALLLSVVLHEVAHGYAAHWLGDPTARLAGRLTVNPISHIDPFGSVILPAVLYMTGSPFLFGWAKPVPYNPYNLNNQRWGESIVAVAGPLTNFLLAIIFAVITHVAFSAGVSSAFLDMTRQIVIINVMLGIFNSIPFPPLDGSKIITPFLPPRLQFMYRSWVITMERMGFFGLFIWLSIFIFLLQGPFYNFVNFVIRLLI